MLKLGCDGDIMENLRLPSIPKHGNKKDVSDLRTDMNRADDNQRADMVNLEKRLRADMRHLEERLFTEINKLNNRMGRLDDRMDKLNHRMDGLYDALLTDIMKVLDKMDGVANDLRAEIRERIHGKADRDED